MEKLTKELEATRDDLGTTIASFSDEEFNKVPFEGSWTAGQVAEHILKSLAHAPMLLMNNIKPAGRNPETNVKTLRDMFLNYNIKFEAALFLQPSEGHHNAKELSTDILALLQQVIAISSKEDLTLLCTDVDIPTIGQLTRVEFLNFISVHTQRHIHQLKNIKKHL